MTDVVAAPVERCPECGSTVLAHDATRGELTCALCGLVLQGNQLDLGSEWHLFDPYAQKNHDDPTRTDLITPLKLPFTSTEIGDPRSRQRKRFARLAQIDRGVQLSAKGFANLRVAIAEICRLCGQLRVSRKVAATAAMYYRKAMAQDLHRGHSILGIATAAVYMAVRQHGLLITLSDLSQFSTIEKKLVSRYFLRLRRELGQTPNLHNLTQFVQRLCTTLKLSRGTTLTAFELIEQVKAKNLHLGKKPAVIAAATVYVAGLLSEERLTQRQIGEVAQVTEVAIRQNYQEIGVALNLDFGGSREPRSQREVWG